MTSRTRAYDTPATRMTSFLTACVINLHVALIVFCGVASAADDIFVSAVLGHLLDAPARDKISLSRARYTRLASLEVRCDDALGSRARAPSVVVQNRAEDDAGRAYYPHLGSHHACRAASAPSLARRRALYTNPLHLFQLAYTTTRR